MPETFNDIMREVGRLTADMPHAENEQRLQLALMFICSRIDSLIEKHTELHRALAFGKLEKLDVPEHN